MSAPAAGGAATDLVLIGASGLAREALAVVRETGSHTPVGVLDDAPDRLGADFDGVPVLGPLSELARLPHAEVLVCVGSGTARRDIVRRVSRAGIRFATVVDPSVRNPADCPIGVGSILLAQVSITAHAWIGEHVVVMPGCTITHDDVIDDYVTLASGVSLGGGVQLQRGAYLGMNAAVLPGVRVGEGSVVGMSAAVLDDVPDGETWAGVPAHTLGRRLEVTA
jgi:sugar O-acyltransferase (sialic acid O-acetyltransferase NeuD family)